MRGLACPVAMWMLSASALVGGCADSPLALPPPTEAERQPSWVLWVNAALAAFAGGPVRYETSEDRVELVLSVYSRPLSELGLMPGEISVGELCRSCELLRPEDTWIAFVEAGQSRSDWERRPMMPDAMRDALVPDAERCDRCRPFAETGQRADDSPLAEINIVLLTPWNGGTLAIHGDGNWRHLIPGSPGRSACIPSPGPAPMTAYRATETVVWLIDSRNRLIRVDLDRLDPELDCRDALTVTSTVRWEGPTLDRIAGPPSETPSELYGIGLDLDTNESRLSRRTPDGRTEFLGAIAGPENDARLAWAGQGNVLAANGGPIILRLEDGRTSHVPVEVEGTSIFVTMVIHDPLFGYVLGTSKTLGLRENGNGGFEYLASFEINAQKIAGLARYGDGLVLAERTGNFRRYFDPEGYCPAQRGFGNEAPQHIVEGPAGALIGGDKHTYYALPAEDRCPQP